MCSCNDSSKLSYDSNIENRDISSIEYFKNLCGNSRSLPITQDITICGVVTANDYLDEFFKTIIIEDSSGGIEIHIDNWYLGDRYPIGSLVLVYCNGLSLGDYGGKIVLGANPTGEYSVDRIYDIKKYIKVVEFDAQKQEPQTIIIADIENPQYIDRLICLENIEFLDSDLSWCDLEIDPETGKSDYVTTVRTIRDGRDEIGVRVHYRCDYAGELLPQGVGTIYGVVGYFNGEYYIQVTNKRVYF